MDKLSAMLPPSLGNLFGQRAEVVAPAFSSKPSDIPGAFNAPELCTLLETYHESMFPKDAGFEVKLDGIRCLHVAGSLRTREGGTFDAAAHCLPILRELEQVIGAPMFFDGEYIEDGGLEATLAAYRSGKGAGVLWLFDAVPFDEWQSGRSSRDDLRTRKARLRNAVLAVNGEKPDCSVGYVEHQPVTLATVEQRARHLWQHNYEGLVIKNMASRYGRKRTCDWLKLKMRTVSQMQVVDVLGTVRDGKETAKSVLVRLPNGASTCKVPVHGGLGDLVWQHRNEMPGQPIGIEHSGFTGGGCPREATIKQLTI